MLSRDEKDRYYRQLKIENFGEAGQEKLKGSKVFISGLGGLGSIITVYLAVAGIGTLRIIDNGRVELSNLNRQILYCDEDLGKQKAEAAKKKLELLNPHIQIEAFTETITEATAIKLIENSDLIVDTLDNYPTRYILNRAALSKKIPFFFGAVSGFRGMVTTIIPGQTGCLRCIVPTPPPPSFFPVIGITPAMIGIIQATEVIKYIIGLGKLLKNRLLVFNGLNLKFDEVAFKRSLNCPECVGK